MADVRLGRAAAGLVVAMAACAQEPRVAAPAWNAATEVRPPVPRCIRLALTVALDRSGSMTGEPLTQAVAAARAALAALTRDDCAAVVTFDTQASLVLPMRVVDDPRAMGRELDRITAGGGTSFRPALELARAESERAPAARRRLVVLVSDGQSARELELVSLVTDMAAHGTVVTSVALGRDADARLLGDLSDAGGGRLYRTQDPASLPRILTREVDVVLHPQPP